jgi:hypothetical protein
MDEPEGPPPHAGERLTREDVLRLIEEHGGPEGVDLSERELGEADLNALDLHGANLSWAKLQKANLRGANLQGAHLWRTDCFGACLYEANLQRATLHEAKLQEANLSHANVQGAYLWRANLQEANLRVANLRGVEASDANLRGADLRWAALEAADISHANLQGADLRRADLRRARLVDASLREAKLDGARWGDYKLGEEIAGKFDQAASIYRALKQRHTEAGIYDIAGEFFYREMEARRKLAPKKRRLVQALWMCFLCFLYGYGERPGRVIGWAAGIIFGLALVHWVFGTVSGAFWDALYYSAVSFTALGYGKWAAEPQGWAGRFLGVGEALLGVFMMALFLVTFTRKMTR